MFYNAAYHYDFYALDKLYIKRGQITNTIAMLKGKRSKKNKHQYIKFCNYLEVINEAIKLKE